MFELLLLMRNELKKESTPWKKRRIYNWPDRAHLRDVTIDGPSSKGWELEYWLCHGRFLEKKQSMWFPIWNSRTQPSSVPRPKAFLRNRVSLYRKVKNFNKKSLILTAGITWNHQIFFFFFPFFHLRKVNTVNKVSNQVEKKKKSNSKAQNCVGRVWSTAIQIVGLLRKAGAQIPQVPNINWVLLLHLYRLGSTRMVVRRWSNVCKRK